MKKYFACLILALAILLQSAPSYAAKTNNALKVAIRKYKCGNYTGCLQDCQRIVKTNPSNALAHYYLAISYAQAGKRTEAISSYSRVLSLRPNAELNEYATTGRRCLETPDQCNPDTGNSTSPELDRFVESSNSLSDSVRKDFEQKHLNSIRDEINNGKDMDDYNFQKLNKIEDNKIAQSKPTDDEVKAALKVLNDAGINPYAQNPMMAGGQSQDQLAQLNMLMGGGSQSMGNSAMMNMLPYMLTQGQQGQQGSNTYSPQAIQAAIMSTMMPNMNFNIDTEQNK